MAGTSKAGVVAPPAETPVGAELTPDQVRDSLDTTVKAPAPDLKGKRIRAIPTILGNIAGGGTTVIVSRADFKANGIDHPKVVFDLRKDRWTLPVGNSEGQISQKAADFLTSKHKVAFEYLDEG